ncbi:MAG: DUF2156 domain-containing protein [Spirochaetales bacterium]|nr:MAG: DUF2156 domain-containing protein [Spirochaetales bacterium]
MGWFDEGYLRESLVMTLVSPEGVIYAFANLVPEYKKNELMVDLMRHRKVTEPGTMDFLFASVITWAKEHGYQSFNLGLSALSGVGINKADPAIERVLHYVYEHINRFYNYKGLHAFKEKFDPAWEPRYLVYNGLAALPNVLVAVLRADSGFPNILGSLRNRKAARRRN